MSNYFDSKRLVELPNGGQGFNDGSDALAQDGLTILFQHVPTGEVLRFKAFITAYNESFSCDWSKEAVFGRSDPIFMFKGTTRKINLAFKIPSSTLGEGYENLGRLQNLAKFLYPVYEDVANALTISQSPLIRLRVINLLQSQSALGAGSRVRSFENFITAGNGTDKKGSRVGNDYDYEQSDGMLGVLHTVNINHNLENTETAAYEAGPQGSRVVIPRMIDVSIDFTCLHEHPLGWRKQRRGTSRFETPGFPYGVRNATVNTNMDPNRRGLGAGSGFRHRSSGTSEEEFVGPQQSETLSTSYDETLALFGLPSGQEDDTPEDEVLNENAEASAEGSSTSSQASSDSEAAAVERATPIRLSS